MDFSQIKRIAEAISKHAHDSEKIAIPILAIKLQRAASEHNQDYTIGLMNKVVARMESDKKSFISRAEIRELYNKLYSRGSVFAEVFAEELGGATELATPTLYNRAGDDYAGSSEQKTKDALIDPVLASGLSEAFGDKVLPVNQSMMNSAIVGVEAATMGIDLKKSVSASTGGENIVVCTASFQTPRGEVSVIVPVEFDNKVSMKPEVFIGNDGVASLDKDSLASYIYSHAGKKLSINADTVLKFALASRADLGKISEVDLAITQLNASRETGSHFSSPQILGQKLNEVENLEVKKASYRDTEIESFVNKFANARGEANFIHTDAVVSEGRNMVARAAASFGLLDAQVSVSESDDDTVFYAVASNSGRVAFKVPVKIENKKLSYPTIIIANGMIDSFSKDAVAALRSQTSMDHEIAARANANYDLKPSELLEVVKKASLAENYAQAEDALNILSQKDDPKAYASALNFFTEALSGKKQASSIDDMKNKCSLVIESRNSVHPICGHTGLPLHKVCQDKNGACRPLHRASEDEVQGGAFSSGKIFI